MAFAFPEKIGRGLGKVEQSTQWWVGDWWAYGEHRYGDRRKLVESETWTGPAYQTCNHAAQVSRAFEFVRRRTNLSFSHHQTLTSLKIRPETADSLLDWCEAPNLCGRWQDPVAFISSANITRRHLTKGQQAMTVAKTKLILNISSDADAAKKVGTSRQYVNYAGLVLQYANELAELVLKGTMLSPIGDRFRTT